MSRPLSKKEMEALTKSQPSFLTFLILLWLGFISVSVVVFLTKVILLGWKWVIG